MHRAPWNKTDTDYLHQHYHQLGAKHIAQHLGRTVFGIRKKAKKEGLKKREQTSRKKPSPQKKQDEQPRNHREQAQKILELKTQLKQARDDNNQMTSALHKTRRLLLAIYGEGATRHIDAALSAGEGGEASE
ncbi:hypothetical protein [uncultured Gilvimarinus sp.]|uniref:hypothetical protein n=1 Tax=uncultured Gilvimarinus sp. TaxID=1689143 RepID=UPI0030D7E6D0